MNSEAYTLFSGYFWLIFPIGWGIAAMFKTWLRHKRAEQTLELIKGYADQGKDIPPDLLNVLKLADKNGRTPRERARRATTVGLIFVALAVAFSVLSWTSPGKDGHDVSGLMFVVVLFAGIAVAFFASAYLSSKDSNRLDAP
jgi:hypothetical protein